MSVTQILGKWRECAIPAEASGAHAVAWERFEAAAAAELGEGAVFEAPPPERRDPETVAALLARDRDGLSLTVDTRGLAFADPLPILYHHFGRIGETSDVAVTGPDIVEFTAWLGDEWVKLLAGIRYLSPRIRVRKARVMELTPSLRIVYASEAIVTEVSVTDRPMRPGTSLMVGDAPDVQFFAPRKPTAPPAPPGERFRALSEEGERRFQARAAERAELERVAAAAESRPPRAASEPDASEIDAAGSTVSREYARRADWPY